MERVILHSDLKNIYFSVELRDHPELRWCSLDFCAVGKPPAVPGCICRNITLCQTNLGPFSPGSWPDIILFCWVNYV